MSQNFSIDSLVNNSPSSSLSLTNGLLDDSILPKALFSSGLLLPSLNIEFSNLAQSMLFNQASDQILSNVGVSSLSNESIYNKNLSFFSNNNDLSSSSSLEDCITENDTQSSNNNKIGSPNLYKLCESDTEKINAEESAPIRQSLSYLDVIFPHIRVIFFY